MGTYDTVRLIIVFVFMVVVLAKVIAKLFFKGNPMTTRFIARTAVFAAISIILYTVPFLKFALPIFPSFLEIHLDEIPALMAGFAYGPLSGFLVILVKTVVKLPLTGTAGVGELADFIYSAVFVIPAAIIYKRHRTIKGAFVSMMVATGIQILVASFVTTFVMLDIYSILYHLPKAVILVKTIVKLPLTGTAGVGELADFIYSAAFVLPAAFIYKKHRTLKGALVSLLVATAVQILVSSFGTTFVMLDMYSILYRLPKPVILNMCKKVNPAVTDLNFKFLLMVALPFNAMKDGIVVVVTALLYKRLRILFKKIDAQKN